MAIPVVAGHAIRTLPALLTRARGLIGRVLPASPAAIAQASKRTGIAGGASRIIGAVRNNKMLTALVLMDLGPEAAELLGEMAQADAEIAELVSRYGVSNDPVAEGTGPNLLDQVDEMQTITDAANAVGGLRALHNLRRAFSLSEEHYKLYDHLRSMRDVVR